MDLVSSFAAVGQPDVPTVRHTLMCRLLLAALVVVCLSSSPHGVGTSADAEASSVSFQNLALPAQTLHTDETEFTARATRTANANRPARIEMQYAVDAVPARKPYSDE
jgi:hypothetical protein